MACVTRPAEGIAGSGEREVPGVRGEDVLDEGRDDMGGRGSGASVAERRECDWTDMTPGDFDREAPLCLNVGTGPVVVPAEPDEYGTAPLFGQEAAGRRPGPRRAPRPPAPGEQGRLF